MQFNNLNSNPYLNKFNMEQAQLQTTHVGEATVSQVASTSDNKEIEAIIQRLRSGDLSALTELTALGIKYEIVTETINGVVKNTIKFSYGGNDYEVNLSLNKDNSDTDKKPNFGNINSNLSDMVKVTGAEQFGKNTNISDVKERIVYSQAKVGSTQTSEQAEQERLQKIYDAMEKELKADLEKEIQYRLDSYSNYGFTTKPSAEQIEQIKNEVWQSIQTQINTFKEFLKTNCASVEEYINSEKDEDGAITNAYQTVFDAMVDSMSASLKKYGAEAKEKAEADKAAAAKTQKGAYSSSKDIVDYYSTMGLWTVDLPEKMTGAVGNNFTLQNDNKTIFDKLFSKIINAIKHDNAAAFQTIGQDNLKKLLQAAWTYTLSQEKASYNSKLESKDFVKKLMANYSNMLGKVASSPDVLEVYLNPNCGDSNLKNGIDGYSTEVNYNKYTKYYDGSIHLNDDNSDKLFQKAMDKLLENIYAKYPNVSKSYLKELFLLAQEEGVSDKKNDNGIVSTATGKTIGSLCQQILSNFDRYIMHNAENLATNPRVTQEQQVVIKPLDESVANDIKAAANDIRTLLPTSEEVYLLCKSANDGKDFDSRFGVDKNGELIFANSKTKSTYETLKSKVKSDIKKYLGIKNSDALEKLGGEAVLDGLIRSAWISAYNLYSATKNSSKDLETFIKKVMENINKMLTKIENNPEMLKIFTMRTSYADSTITNDVTGYGKDEKVGYAGIRDKNKNIDSKFIYADGSIHLDNQDDDKKYTAAMDGILGNLISKYYPRISKDVITETFREAQKAALTTAIQDYEDCPYGTSNDGQNGGRVEDGGSKIGSMCKNGNRVGDKNQISLDQLVQLTLYYFDKLILNKLMN